MKKLIVTIAIGDFHQDLLGKTCPLMKAYAENVGADFLVIDDIGDHQIPHYRKLDLGELLNEYDRVCYLDSDILVRPDAPNIFDIVPENKFGAHSEGKFEESRLDTLERFLKRNGCEPHEGSFLEYFNTGVMVFSKCHQPIFLTPAVESNNFYEQTYFNMLFHMLKVQMVDLSYKFNRMGLHNRRTGEHRLDGFFIHYAGIKDIYGEKILLELVDKDLEELNSQATGKEYKFKKRILVAMQGGLGDQVASEPALRYMVDHLYKGDEFHVCSFWPELFDHLPVKLYNKVENVVDKENMFITESYRDGSHDSWHFMSQGAMHQTDFAALQLFKGGLPQEHKRPKVTFSPTDMATMIEKLNIMDFGACVILHPGKGWPSKTFPASTWYEYAKAIKESGMTPIILGKTVSDRQGVVEFDRSEFVDAVDLLTLKEMCALISVCPVLISNESSPIHIAGAFDNWIGIISTGKRPEFVLPYRYDGGVWWRARALEKYKRYDAFKTLPTNIEPRTMDEATEWEIENFCPSSLNILKFVYDAMEDMVKSRISCE